MAAGLPVEGNGERTIGEIARPEVPTCSPNERMRDVTGRVRDAGWDVCVVVNDSRVVFGLLRAEQLDGDPAARVEDVMRPGPSTFRPHVPVQEMAAYMTRHTLASSPVTTSDGRLVGMLMRDDAVRAAHEQHGGGSS